MIVSFTMSPYSVTDDYTFSLSLDAVITEPPYGEKEPWNLVEGRTHPIEEDAEARHATAITDHDETLAV